MKKLVCLVLTLVALVVSSSAFAKGNVFDNVQNNHYGSGNINGIELHVGEEDMKEINPIILEVDAKDALSFDLANCELTVCVDPKAEHISLTLTGESSSLVSLDTYEGSDWLEVMIGFEDRNVKARLQLEVSLPQQDYPMIMVNLGAGQLNLDLGDATVGTLNLDVGSGNIQISSSIGKAGEELICNLGSGEIANHAVFQRAYFEVGCGDVYTVEQVEPIVSKKLVIIN